MEDVKPSSLKTLTYLRAQLSFAPPSDGVSSRLARRLDSAIRAYASMIQEEQRVDTDFSNSLNLIVEEKFPSSPDGAMESGLNMVESDLPVAIQSRGHSAQGEDEAQAQRLLHTLASHGNQHLSFQANVGSTMPGVQRAEPRSHRCNPVCGVIMQLLALSRAKPANDAGSRANTAGVGAAEPAAPADAEVDHVATALLQSEDVSDEDAVAALACVLRTGAWLVSVVAAEENRPAQAPHTPSAAAAGAAGAHSSAARATTRAAPATVPAAATRVRGFKEAPTSEFAPRGSVSLAESPVPRVAATPAPVAAPAVTQPPGGGKAPVVTGLATGKRKRDASTADDAESAVPSPAAAVAPVRANVARAGTPQASAPTSALQLMSAGSLQRIKSASATVATAGGATSASATVAATAATKPSLTIAAPAAKPPVPASLAASKPPLIPKPVVPAVGVGRMLGAGATLGAASPVTQRPKAGPASGAFGTPVSVPLRPGSSGAGSAPASADRFKPAKPLPPALLPQHQKLEARGAGGRTIAAVAAPSPAAAAIKPKLASVAAVIVLEDIDSQQNMDHDDDDDGWDSVSARGSGSAGASAPPTAPPTIVATARGSDPTVGAYAQSASVDAAVADALAQAAVRAWAEQGCGAAPLAAGDSPMHAPSSAAGAKRVAFLFSPPPQARKVRSAGTAAASGTSSAMLPAQPQAAASMAPGKPPAPVDGRARRAGAAATAALVGAPAVDGSVASPPLSRLATGSAAPRGPAGEASSSAAVVHVSSEDGATARDRTTRAGRVASTAAAAGASIYRLPSWLESSAVPASAQLPASAAHESAGSAAASAAAAAGGAGTRYDMRYGRGAPLGAAGREVLARMASHRERTERDLMGEG